jgi:NadR type nicotinamide-nucleotide adenylyltransferase
MEQKMERKAGISIRRIAITGPESTGKSQLASDLADYYNTVWVPEYAREYLRIHGASYTLEDIVNIARGQSKNERELVKKAKGWIFCDTEGIVTKIWAEHAFHSCPQEISDEIDENRYDYYLLCDIDLAWKPDPLREHPHLRPYFFDLFKNELSGRKLPFSIVRGIGNERTRNAINILKYEFSIE